MIIKKRKSETCPPFCKEKGCYDTFEKIIIDGEEFKVWISGCKSLKRISNQAISSLIK